MARKRSAGQGESLFRATREAQPLAARMRPRTLDEFVGQEHLLAPGKPLREAIERGVPGSMIFWGRREAARRRWPIWSPAPIAAGVRALQRRLRGRAADPRDRGRGPSPARRRRLADHPVRGRDPPAQQGPAGQPAAALRGRHDHPDRRHHRESQLRDQRGAALAHPGLRAPAAQRGARGASCCGGRWRIGSAGSAGWSCEVEPDAIDAIAVEADGDARRALTVLEAAAAHVGEGGHDHRWRWRARRCRSGSPATTRRARSTSTCSPPTTSRSAAATRRARSTGWRGCSTAARIR